MKILWLFLAALLLSGWGCVNNRRQPAPAAEHFELNPLFSDNMVLQRGQPSRILGTATPGQWVSLEINRKHYHAAAAPDGNWSVTVDPLPKGGPYTMRVSGMNRMVTVRNIMSGDVWLCAGQSNMQWSVRSTLNAEREIAEAGYPDIRLFQANVKVSEQPLPHIHGRWMLCSPETVADFSGTAYYFGRELHKNLRVPIGLIHVSGGASPIESWIKQEFMDNDPVLGRIMENHRRMMSEYPALQAEYEQAREKTTLERVEDMMHYNDPGDKGLELGWANPDFNDEDWQTAAIPATWDSFGLNINGAVWFRKELNIPPQWHGYDLELSLGPIDDFDNTYFNGYRVGGITEGAGAWRTPRRYRIPAALAIPGRAVLAVRVFDHYGSGGFRGKPEHMWIRPVDSQTGIRLSGDWKYRVSLPLKAKTTPMLPPYGPEHPFLAGGIYNAAIHPLIPFALRGVVWYHGEGDVFRAAEYRTLLPAMIRCWRQNRMQNDLPFLIVQLAGYRRPEPNPAGSIWAEMREVQAQTAKDTAACELVVAIDLGEPDNIHPRNKQELGRRLALAATASVRGGGNVFSSPVYHSHRIDGNRIIVEFTGIENGLVSRDGPLAGFEIAGADQHFYRANAMIDGNRVIVSGDSVARPVAVRYAWSDFPEKCNLYNRNGLPAAPFRTDDWAGLAGKAETVENEEFVADDEDEWFF